MPDEMGSITLALRRIRSGDTEAICEIIERFETRLLIRSAHALDRRTSSWICPEDLLQESLLAFWQRIQIEWKAEELVGHPTSEEMERLLLQLPVVLRATARKRFENILDQLAKELTPCLWRIDSRFDLLRLLTTIIINETLQANRRQLAKKRGGDERTISLSYRELSESAVSREPTPEHCAHLGAEIEALIDQLPNRAGLQDIARDWVLDQDSGGNKYSEAYKRIALKEIFRIWKQYLPNRLVRR